MRKHMISLFLAIGLLTSACAHGAFYIPDGAITTSKLNDSFINGLTAVTPADDDYVSLADTSDSNKKKKGLISTIKNSRYRSVTSTDTASLLTDQTLKLSGASFTETLPTAVTYPGKRFTLIHQGTSFSQVYTIQTTSSQTIGGVAGGSYALYTFNEQLTVESDGTNWMIVSHKASLPMTAYTPTFTGVGTAASININYWREGEFLYVTGQFTAGTATAVTLTVSFPTSVQAAKTGIGTFYLAGIGYSPFTNTAWANNATQWVDAGATVFYYQQPANSVRTASTGSQMGSSVIMTVNAKIPIQGWQP